MYLYLDLRCLLQELQTTLPAGSILRDRYVVEDLLGQGGFGAVYLVRDLRVKGNLYALKEVIDPNKKDRKRFIFESELLKRLDHRAFPRVYRVFEDEEHHRAYMLMDYIEGENLEKLRLQQPEKRFSLPQVLTLLAPIMDAITYLHGQNPPILHRDIKPSNIILPATGEETVLVDFGIAKEFDKDATTTAVRSCSPGYAAPEQYSRGTSIRTDIYGLGATLYVLLTGKVPTDALYRMTAIGSGQVDPLEPPRKFVPSIPQHIEQAIIRALSINSNDRFASVEELWQALNAHPTWRQLTAPVIMKSSSLSQMGTLIPRRPVVTPLHSTITIHKQKCKRLTRLLLLVPAVLLIILAAAVGFFSYATNGQKARSFAPTTQASSTITTIIASPTITAYPTHMASPSPHTKVKATPTSRPVIQPTIIVTIVPPPIPTMRPTPPSTKTPQPSPSPTPRPTPSPTPVPYPNVAGNYTGTIFDQTENITTGMTLYIQQKIGQASITGYFTVNPPLVGSGNFTGSVNTNKYIQFTVQSYHGNAPLYFWGWVQQDSSLKGDYCSLNSKGQCDPSVGDAGTWNVSESGS